MTGSSSGNGRAIAVCPAAEGATVVCSDIRREACEGGYESDANTSTDELITATGGKSQYVRGRRRQLLADGEPHTAVSEYGRLDVMVNNAGIVSGLHTIVDENRR